MVWANNLDTKIADLEITAKLEGTIYSRSSVTAGGGFYDSNTATVFWDKRHQSSFGSIDPGQNGTVSFSFGTISVGTDPALWKNPSMIIHVSVHGKRLDEQGVYQDVTSTFTKEIKIASALGLLSRLSYGSGPLMNSGPVPPKAEVETTYTITWSLSNSSNSVSNAQVRAVLPSYVRFVGAVSPSSESVAYSSVGGEVVWNVGEMKSGVGFGTSPREVSFQIAFLPSVSQIGEAPIVIGEAVASGEDRFTLSPVERSVRSALTTGSLSEGAAGKGIVVK